MMRSYSLFDTVGPIMHGPSSNHTGGATRLGFYYREIMGGLPDKITFVFHPFLMRFYKGHRTHFALMAGCLGMREYDEDVNNSPQYMKEKNVQVQYEATNEENPDRNLMRIKAEYAGVCWNINGISIGAGNIVIDSVNGMKTEITGDTHLYFYLLKQKPNLNAVQAICQPKDINEKEIPEGHLLYLSTIWELTDEERGKIEDMLGEIILKRHVFPLHPFAEKITTAPKFKTFIEMERMCQSMDIAEAAIQYEMDRSKTTREQIMEEAYHIVDVEKGAIDRGLQGNVPLIGGFIGNSDAKLAAEWGKSGKSILGMDFSMALARALAVSEMSAGGGLIAAVPTCGSAGTLPGIIFSVGNRFNADKDKLAKAFLVAAAIGTIVGNKSTFSGSVGGCQVEVGVGAAMGAGAAVWLAGGSFAQVKHAFSLTLKNVLGLICDQPVSPVEIPCVKRNAMGVAVGLMGAELALAGIESAIPADQVIDALVDTVQRMPNELRCSCIGGLAATAIAKELQQKWTEKIERNNS